MKNKLSKFKILLIIPFLFGLNSCGKGKEINIDSAKEIYNQIKKFHENEENFEGLSYKYTSDRYDYFFDPSGFMDISKRTIISNGEAYYNYTKRAYEDNSYYESEYIYYIKDNLYRCFNVKDNKDEAYLDENLQSCHKVDMNNSKYQKLVFGLVLNVEELFSREETKYYSKGEGHLFIESKFYHYYMQTNYYQYSIEFNDYLLTKYTLKLDDGRYTRINVKFGNYKVDVPNN